MGLDRQRYQKPGGHVDAPVDDLIDLAHAGVSLAAREMCCRVATDSGSFARATSNLARLAGVVLSDETLRRVAETEGRAVLAWQDDGQLELEFEAGKCLTDQTPGDLAVSRVYVGIDGFMLPMVTEAENQKRFDKAAARRKTLEPTPGKRRPKLVRRPGADQRYKEIKQVTMYDQFRLHKLVRATRLGVKQAAKIVRQMAADVKLKVADQVVAVTDGAEWIGNLIENNLPAKTVVVLDYYHASEHVHKARRVVFGEDNPAGKAWADQLLGHLYKGTYQQWWDQLVTTRSTTRAPTKRAALDDLMGYLLPRKHKVDYASFTAAGYDIGSGPTESTCKSLSRRMKGIGMRWTAKNAESMVALEALHQSQLWPTYWSTRLAA